MRDFTGDIQWLSINTATVRKQWTLDQIIEAWQRRAEGAGVFMP